MRTIRANLIGRFGNQMFTYAHTLALAQKNGLEICSEPWIGERIFDIPNSLRGNGDTSYSGYAQTQNDIIYTRRWLLNTFRLRPELKQKLDVLIPDGEIVAHLRRGDYGPLGYVLVSKEAYRKSAIQHGFDPDKIVWVSEDNPTTHPDFTGELSLLPDFYRMMKAAVLFRANSSFSWWAGTLGRARVFAPVIEGIAGGESEKDCQFVEGNWPRCANLDGITDLHMFQESERYDYPLTAASLVIDCGGYDGDFTQTIQSKYGCDVIVFEPEPNKWNALLDKFSGNPKITILNGGVGKSTRRETMRVHGSMTGAFADGLDFNAMVWDIATFANRPVDLLKLNIEGMEYEVLERIIECDLAKNITDIQVQFHGVAPDSAKRYAAVREALCKTHRMTFDEPWTWQNFERL